MFANRHGFALSVLILGVLTSLSQAADKAAVDAAVAKGAAYLRALQQKDGSWSYAESGATSLAALALLESDLKGDDKKANDEAIAKAANFVRAAAPKMTHTYSVSLAIVFLDRLGDDTDVPLIESLMIRLMAAQTGDGGWGYQCPSLSNAEIQRLTAFLGKRAELKGSFKLPGAGKRKNTADLQEETKQQLRQGVGGGAGAPGGAGGGLGGAPPVGGAGPIGFASDNSNTQFATLAMWVGRKHGLPVDGALSKLYARFRDSQDQKSGSWGYMSQPKIPGGPVMPEMPGFGPSVQMTAAGVMAITIAYGIDNDPALRGRRADPKRDANLMAGLRFMAACLPANEGKAEKLGKEQSKIFYSLWSIERACVALNLDDLGGKDWHAWGTDLLLGNQGADGGWRGEYDTTGGASAYGADTAFAILFLRKVNFMHDLSAMLKGHTVVLKANTGRLPGVRPITAPEKKQGEDPRGKDQPKPKPLPDKREKTKEEKLSDSLVNAKGGERKDLIEKYEKTGGTEYSDALALSIAFLSDDMEKQEVRDALQRRLGRFKDTTLGGKIGAEDEIPEIRAAAMLAAAGNKYKNLIPDIIKHLANRDPYVAAAAHKSLTVLTGEDFGPTPEATREQIEQSIQKWKAWWDKNRS